MHQETGPRGGWLALAAVRLAAELGMLAALGYVGWRIAAGNQGLGLLLALVLVGGAAATWGAWVAPRSPRRLPDPARLAVEVVLFALAVTGLLLVAEGVTARVLAAVLGAAYAVSAPVGRRGW